MSNFYTDNDDLRFYVEEAIDWEPLVRLNEREFGYEDGFDSTEEAVDFYESVLEMVGRFIGEEVAPYAQEIDEAGVVFADGEVRFPERLQSIFEQIKELGLHRLCVPRELGGMNVPVIVYMILAEMFSRAEVSVSHHFGFHGGIAMALLAYSIQEGTTEFDEDGFITDTRFEEAMEEIMAGEAWGSMDITEPDAGSDMAALRTKAEHDEEGNWYVSGQKIFITSGHGKYHVVIARTEEPEDGGSGEKSGAMGGLDALSTFLVRAYEEDEETGERIRHATVERIEEKLGNHASSTCTVQFEQAPAELIGERGEGFKQMLLLMNNARVAVAFEAIGLCEDALRKARDYASERESMGKTIDRHEMIADYLDEMETDLLGMRALAVEAGIHEEMGRKIEIWLEGEGLSAQQREELEAQKEEHQWEARRLTPLLKYIASEKAVEMSRRCIQIHGGVGYTTEYGAEKLLRDAVVMPIYEGTSQIQALMATKDSLKEVVGAPQEFVKELAQTRWRTFAGESSADRKLAEIQLAGLRAVQHLVQKTAVDKFKSVTQRPPGEWMEGLTGQWDPDRDFAYALLHAEHLTRILCDVAICETLYEQGREHPERRELFWRYAERAEPRCHYQLKLITSTGERMIDELHPEAGEGGAAAE